MAEENFARTSVDVAAASAKWRRKVGNPSPQALSIAATLWTRRASEQARVKLAAGVERGVPLRRASRFCHPPLRRSGLGGESWQGKQGTGGNGGEVGRETATRGGGGGAETKKAATRTSAGTRREAGETARKLRRGYKVDSRFSHLV